MLLWQPFPFLLILLQACDKRLNRSGGRTSPVHNYPDARPGSKEGSSKKMGLNGKQVYLHSVEKELPARSLTKYTDSLKSS